MHGQSTSCQKYIFCVVQSTGGCELHMLSVPCKASCSSEPEAKACDCVDKPGRSTLSSVSSGTDGNLHNLNEFRSSNCNCCMLLRSCIEDAWSGGSRLPDVLYETDSHQVNEVQTKLWQPLDPVFPLPYAEGPSAAWHSSKSSAHLNYCNVTVPASRGHSIDQVSTS